jgi:glycosyltransferase involved in cell wall biosynthesis
VGRLKEGSRDLGSNSDPYDPASIGDAIRSLVTDDAMRQEYATRTLRRAKLFAWDKCARQTLEVLEAVGTSD